MSAHRTPELLTEFAKTAADEGIKVIIGGAGGAAHLPCMIAAHTSPCVRCSVHSSQLGGVDSLYCSNAKGRRGWYLAISEAGAANAGLLAAQMLAVEDPELTKRVIAFREAQTQMVLENNQLELDE